MLTQLDVVNDCLAIMGEARLNSLAEEHPFKGAVIDKLAVENRRIQAKGWWYNTESMKLLRDRLDKRIHLPDDIGATITFDNRPNLTQRGRFVYDLENGTYEFPEGTELASRFVRIVAFEDLPISAACYIAAEVLVWFQSQYDGDQTKTRNLMATRDTLLGDMKLEHIRNRKVNLFDSNARLQRIRLTINDARYGGYPNRYRF